MTVIYSGEFAITPDHNQTNICVDFQVDKEYAALEFRCEYFPKELEDEERAERLIRENLIGYLPEEATGTALDWRQYLPLKNLVTLSLDCEGEYVGCAHRQAQKQVHRISERQASPGFFRRRPVPGGWRAVINVHALLSDKVDYRLQVVGLEEEEAL